MLEWRIEAGIVNTKSRERTVKRLSAAIHGSWVLFLNPAYALVSRKQ
jgi:hypothetical protein